MSKTTLRTYNREIESLIEQNQFEQAIAHARHILQFFPKHIHTYRLLGKAYLESQRYGDAADVFQRVLSAIPDDFVSQVGMSIIREDEGNLDEAIWHMERAFEIQPANGAIQGELRRLYGRRDGMEPPKVRLTRGALARMYLKGELYQQAIAELRAALAEDPQRPDLLALLAQAYFMTGQRVEAADTCSALLKKTPYCLEANRILADILANTERSAEAQTYRQRAQALDPYAAHTSPAAPSPERVPDTAVSLEKLVWTPGQPITGPQGQPEWAASLGVDIGAAATHKEVLPEWLSDQPEKTPAPTPEPSEAAPEPTLESAAPSEEITETPPEGDQIPEWMKDLGWGPSTGEAGETAAPEMEALESLEQPSEEITPAEIPDWLQDIAPGEAPQAGQEAFEAEEGQLPADESALTGSDALSWLEETPPGPTGSVDTWLEEEQPPTSDESLAPELEAGEPVEVPDWLKGLEKLEPEPEVPLEAGLQAEPELLEAAADEMKAERAEEEPPGLPGWLAGAAMTPGAVEADAEELPDWLKESGEQVGAETEGEVPEWLRETGSLEAQTGKPSEEVPESAQPDTQAEDEAFAWLESLAAKQGAQEALILKPEERRETPPDWVLEAASEETVEPAPSQEPGASEWPSVESSETAHAEEEVEAERSEPAEEIPEWLRGFETEGQAEPEGAVQQFEEFTEEPEAMAEAELASPAEEIPEWLRGMEEGAVGPGEAAQLFEEVTEEPEALGEVAPAEELPVWLSGLEVQAESQAGLDEVAEEPQALGEAAPAEELPVWLSALEVEARSQAEPAEEAQRFEELAGEPEEAAQLFEEITNEPEALDEATPAEEIPGWLRGAEGMVEPEAELADAEQQFEELAEEFKTPGEAERSEPAEELPEWLRDVEGVPQAGVEEGAQLFEEFAEEPAPDTGAWQIEEQFEQSLDTTGAEPAELPDWLRDIGPEASAEQPGEAQEEALETAELPDWLAGYKPFGEAEPELEMLFSPQMLATGQPELASAEETPSMEGEPEALSDTQPTRVRPPAELAPTPVEAEVPAVEPLDEGIPEWLQGLGEEPPVGETTMETPFEEVRPETLEVLEFEVPEDIQQAPSEDLLFAPAEEAVFEAPEVPEQAPAEISTETPPETTAETAGVPLDDEAAFAWLEGLAARQGAEEAMLLKPEERSETPPEWVQKAAEEAEAPSIEAVSPEAQPVVEEGLPVTPAEQIEPPTFMEAEAPAEPASAPEEIMAPFEPLAPEEPEAEPQFEPLAPEEPEAEPKFEVLAAEEVKPEAQEAPPELPSWLSGVEQETAPEEELAWKPPEEAEPEVAGEAIETPPVLEPFQPEEAPPAWVDLNQAGLAELERLPGVGFIRAQSIMTHRQEVGPFTSVDDLINVAGFDEALVESLRDRVGLGEVQPFEPAPETVDTYQVTLIQARNALIQGETAQALAHYNSLIKAQQALPDVIQDLNEALYRSPVDVSIWEALGDAHMRIGHLQEALDAYTKAEELIR